MQTNLNLSPLEGFLTTGIPPRKLARKLDELMFDYAQMAFNLHLRRELGEDVIHEGIPNFLFYLKELRDVLRKC